MSQDISNKGGFLSETQLKKIGSNSILVGTLLVDSILVSLHVFFCIWLDLSATIINLDREANIPTWWSSAQLLVAGGAFGLVGIRNMHQNKYAWLLILIAAVLIVMSLDETASIHERAGRVVDLVFGNRSEAIFKRTGLWFAVVGLPFAVFFGFLVFKTQRVLEAVPNTSFRLVAGMTLLLTGALVAEAITNLLGVDTLYLIGVAFEEGLEMAGGNIILWAGFTFLLRHMSMQGF